VREIAEAAGREVVREALLAIASTSPIRSNCSAISW
jgi:hypothetical protein